MDITNFFKEIEISDSSKEEIKEFLQVHESSIKNYIIELFDKFRTEKTIEVPNNESSANNPEMCEHAPQKTDDSIALLSKVNSTEVNLISNNSSTENCITDSNNTSPQNTKIISDKENVISKSKSESTQSTVGTNIPTQEKSYITFETQFKNKSILLINGKVNQEYNFNFDINGLGIPEIGEFWFEGLDVLGLNFNTQTNEITGVPITAGDHKLKLKAKRNDWVEGKPIFERTITLIINPDPKSLWKNIPTPEDIEYYKPDSDKEYIKVEAHSSLISFSKTIKKDIVAASQRGRSHAQEGKPRDDDFKMKYLNDHDWYIMSVADGAGSAKSSRKGSEIACNTVIEQTELHINAKTKELERLIKEFHAEKTDEKRKRMGDMLYSIIGTAVFKAYKNIEEEAKKTNVPVKDFSTTLILSISKKFKFGWFVAAFWVGDGGIAIYNKETQFLKVLGESDGGEYAGQTRFLTMPEITQPAELYRRLRFDIVDDFTALILMTDGVSDPKFETDANLMKVEKWNELWNDLSKEVEFKDNNEVAAQQLLSWLDFWSPGNHDDRTIAILY